MKGWLICFGILLFQACGNKKDVPAHIIPREEMETVLWDLMRADQFLGNYVFNRDSSRDRTRESLLYYDRIFRLHNITRDQFRESFSWYRFHPAIFKDIMDSLSAPITSSVEVLPAPVLASPDTVRKIPVPVPDTAKKKRTFIPVE